MPILPTTPFILLASFCFFKSSKKIYNRVTNSPILGRYIKNYIENRGLTLKSKIVSVILLWILILTSILLFISAIWLKILMLIIAAAVSVHILLIKTTKDHSDLKATTGSTFVTLLEGKKDTNDATKTE